MSDLNLPLFKAEDPEAYKKLAERGIMVAHTVSINGNSTRPDVGLPYHSTVKFFDPEKDHPTAIHEVARGLKFPTPNAESTGITPSVFKDRFGNDVHVLKLHGEDADQIKTNNQAFSHMGYPATYEYTPHISLDKPTWQNIVDSGAKTAAEAGISFGHAQLRQGHNVLTTYKHGQKKPAETEEKLAASEVSENDLQKGMKHLATAAAMAAAIGVSSPTPSANSAVDVPAHQASAKSNYSSEKMLRTIAQVESSGGKFTNHRMIGGKTDGAQAYGKYGLMPNTIRETVQMNRDLSGKYGKAQQLDGPDLHHFMQDNPGLEDQIATKHLARLEHHFGQDPATLGYAWLEGIRGTYKAQKEKKDIQSHWHVAKIKRAYGEQR